VDYFIGHYGVDWLAALLMFMSIWRLGERKRDGFLWSAAAAAAWIAFNVLVQSGPGMAINAVVLGLSLRSWTRWSTKAPSG
jgi:hypothetical protein